MGGYLDDTEGSERADKPAKAKWWKTILFSVAYMIPLFWLWSSTDFPDSLGIRITAHGRTGLLENWYYSYLLLQRHHPLDIITFFYMWSIIAGFLFWIVFKKFQATDWTFYSESEVASRRNVSTINPLISRAALPNLSPSEWVLISLLSVAILSGLGWAFGFNPEQLRGIATSESSVRDRCFNEKGSYPQVEVNSACRQLIGDSTVAIRNQPNDDDAYFDRGFAYEHAGDLKHAVADFSEVIRLKPDRSQAYFFRWAAYHDLGEMAQADADLAALNRFDPTFAAQLKKHH